MRAFTETVVTKAALIAALEKHSATDALVQGFGYWKGNGNGKGCAVGCSIHDFAPGTEDQHRQYEPLFGIPQAIAGLGGVLGGALGELGGLGGALGGIPLAG